MIQCRKCHGCEHFFRLLVQTRQGLVADWQVNDVIEHFCVVNKASRQDFDAHARELLRGWRRLSSLRWRVDLRPHCDKLIDAEPSAEIGALNDGDMQWDDPGDGRRRKEFMQLLTAISAKYGYWIGAATLHVFPKDKIVGEYSIVRTADIGAPDGPMAPHRLEWSGEEMKSKSKARKKK